MSHITEKEIRHLAKLANLKLNEAEIQQLIPEIESVLEYAATLQDVAKTYDNQLEQQHDCTTNVMRDDTVIRYEAASLLKQAPDSDGTYFVVPSILNTGE